MIEIKGIQTEHPPEGTHSQEEALRNPTWDDLRRPLYDGKYTPAEYEQSRREKLKAAIQNSGHSEESAKVVPQELSWIKAKKVRRGDRTIPDTVDDMHVTLLLMDGFPEKDTPPALLLAAGTQHSHGNNPKLFTELAEAGRRIDNGESTIALALKRFKTDEIASQKKPIEKKSFLPKLHIRIGAHKESQEKTEQFQENKYHGLEQSFYETLVHPAYDDFDKTLSKIRTQVKSDLEVYQQRLNGMNEEELQNEYKEGKLNIESHFIHICELRVADKIERDSKHSWLGGSTIIPREKYAEEYENGRKATDEMKEKLKEQWNEYVMRPKGFGDVE